MRLPAAHFAVVTSDSVRPMCVGRNVDTVERLIEVARGDHPYPKGMLVGLSAETPDGVVVFSDRLAYGAIGGVVTHRDNSCDDEEVIASFLRVFRDEHDAVAAEVAKESEIDRLKNVVKRMKAEAAEAELEAERRIDLLKAKNRELRDMLNSGHGDESREHTDAEDRLIS